MNSFLHKAAHILKSNYGSNLQNLAIVLPNKRAALYLRESFAKIYTENIWLPKFITIEEYIYLCANVSPIDKLQNIMNLFNAYNQLNDGANFTNFVKWGTLAINDFNDIDKHAVDANALFNYLTEVKALELWSTNNDETNTLSDFQKDYLSFWNNLFPIYNNYKKILKLKKTMPQGMACMHAVETFETNKSQVLKFANNFIFIGFNAFTKSEELLIGTYISTGTCKFIWNVDQYYYANKQHEAGKFLRAYLQNQKFNSNTLFDNTITTEFKPFNQLKDSCAKIKSYETASIHNQVLSVATILQNYVAKGISISNVAVVLADEQLLIPILYALPKEIEHVNLTLGYPINKTEAFHFLTQIFDIITLKLKHGKNTIFYKSFIDLLQNATCNTLFKNSESNLIINYLVEKNIVVVTEKLLKKFEELYNFPEILIKILYEVDSEKILTNLIELFNLLQEHTIQKTGVLNTFYIEVFAAIKSNIEQLKNYLAENDLQLIGLPEINSLFKTLANNITVSFKGEPLIGLQIMGVLETRLLDFEHVIIVGLNEGKMPASNKKPSFITYDVKMNFGINNSADNDSIFSFHFYRLLQFAKEIHLIFCEGIVGRDTVEKSRFVLQVENELLPYAKNMSYKKINYLVNKNNDLTTQKINIKKNKEILEVLYKKMASGISPSALNTYRNCSLKFYFSYVQKLREENEVLEFVDNVEFGILLHTTLQNIYKSYINKKIDAAFFNVTEEQILAEIKLVFEETKQNNNYNFGENYITLNAILTQIKQYLNAEKKIIIKEKTEIKIVGLEEKINYLVNLNINNIDMQINYSGNIDRLEEKNGILHIIDYKSGKVEKKDLIVRLKKDSDEIVITDYAFQTLFYALITTKKYEKPVMASIFSFKNFTDLYIPLNFMDDTLLTGNLLTEFENHINFLTKEILNSEINFTQTIEQKTCDICDFKSICKK